MTQDVKVGATGSVVLLWPDGRSPHRQFPDDPTEPAHYVDALETLRQALWSGGRLGPGIVDASPDCIEVLDQFGNLQFSNPAAHGLFGPPSTDRHGGKPWHETWPRNLALTIATTLSVAKAGTTTRFRDWRPAADGEPRFWDVVVSPLNDDKGALIGLLAVSRDMTGLQRIEESHELRRRELSHQVKNVFALVNGLITLSARSIPVVQPFARSLRDRFLALDRALAHLHRRSDTAEGDREQTVRSLLQILLAPYDTVGSAERRFTFVGVGDAPIGSSSATSLALVIHELATNAVKHGALSTDAGTVRVTCRREGRDLFLIWTERGGPAIEGPPDHAGFGSSLMQRSVTGQLGGKIASEWASEGLITRICLSRSCLAR